MIFKNSKKSPPKIVRLTKKNLASWPNFKKLFDNGEVKFDSQGRLRYKHGAPAGDLILTRIRKDGVAIYKESATEWFDPGSQMAKDFIWS